MACEERQFVVPTAGAGGARIERSKRVSVRAGPSFGLGALLLVFAIVGGCIALGRIDPLWAILGAALAGAGLLRTSRIVLQALASGRTMGNGTKFVAFILAVGTMLAAIAVMASAAGLAAAAAWVAGRCLDVAFQESWISIVTAAWGLVVGLGMGLFAAERIVAKWQWPR
jgi:hypothetical protein